MIEISSLLSTMVGIIFLGLILAPTILLLFAISRGTGKDKSTASVKRIEQLEQNDHIIVEDTNNAIEELLQRIEALEGRIEKDENTIKGFAKK